jgi:hypothetical protein
VNRWLGLHQNGEGPVDALRRSIGNSSWKVGELPTLQLLDRYCFRCHSSMYYDVFDRTAVIKEKGSSGNPGPLILYVSSGFMPQGRKIGQQEKDQFVNYLKNLK